MSKKTSQSLEDKLRIHILNGKVYIIRFVVPHFYTSSFFSHSHFSRLHQRQMYTYDRYPRHRSSIGPSSLTQSYFSSIGPLFVAPTVLAFTDFSLEILAFTDGRRSITRVQRLKAQWRSVLPYIHGRVVHKSQHESRAQGSGPSEGWYCHTRAYSLFTRCLNATQ